jgi:GAF domain-containing protein
VITPTLEALLRFTSGLASRLTVDDDEDSLRAVAGDLRNAFGVEAVTVVVSRGAGRSLVGYPDLIEPLERLQHRVGEGPGHGAATHGDLVVVPDLAERETEWPTYVPLALRGGIRSALAVPLRLDERPAGALTLYGTSVRDTAPEEMTFSVAMAEVLSGFLANSEAYHEQQQLARQLQGALESRVRIEQAKGILSASEGISIAGAFDRIRSYARSHHQTVAAVAAQVVDGELRP